MAKRKKPEDEQDINSIMQLLHPAIPTSDDREDHNVPQEQKTDGNGGSSDRMITELQQRLAALENQNAEMRRTNMALMTQPIQTSQIPQRPVLDESAAPDPLEDPKGYAAFVRRQALAEVDYQRQVDAAQRQAELSQAQKVQNLQNEFATKYKDYAADPEKVEIAATKVAKQAAARGLDLNKYMFGASTTFMEDVKNEMDRLFNIGAKKTVEADDEEGEEEENRTTGMFGGVQSGGRPSGGAPKAEKLGSLTDDIRTFQEKHGFNR